MTGVQTCALPILLSPVGLDAHDRGEKAIGHHRPEHKRIGRNDDEKPDRLQPQRHVVAPMKAAPIRPRDDPMCKQDDVEKTEPERRRPPARPHAFLEKPAIKQRKSGDKKNKAKRSVERGCRPNRTGRRPLQSTGQWREDRLKQAWCRSRGFFNSDSVSAPFDR